MGAGLLYACLWWSGRASATASAALAWTAAKVWAYMFKVVLVWLWPREADTVRTSAPLLISREAFRWRNVCIPR